MADPRALIRARLKELRLAATRVSVDIGHNRAYINQYLKREVPKVLPEETRERLEDHLGFNRGDLRQTRNMTNHSQLSGNVRIPTQPQSDTIPILGAVEGGPDGYFLWNGEIVGHRTRPPELATAPKGFGLYVVGTSMEPRYHAGEVVYVNPGKPVTANCYVVVQLTPLQEGDPPRAMVKQFLRKTATKLVLRQYHPDKVIELPAGDVISVQRIVGSGE